MQVSSKERRRRAMTCWPCSEHDALTVTVRNFLCPSTAPTSEVSANGLGMLLPLHARPVQEVQLQTPQLLPVVLAGGSLGLS